MSLLIAAAPILLAASSKLVVQQQKIAAVENQPLNSSFSEHQVISDGGMPHPLHRLSHYKNHI